MSQRSLKSPRHYAAEIMALHSRAERAALLERAPKEWQGLIATHVRLAFGLGRRHTSTALPDAMHDLDEVLHGETHQYHELAQAYSQQRDSEGPPA